LAMASCPPHSTIRHKMGIFNHYLPGDQAGFEAAAFGGASAAGKVGGEKGDAIRGAA